MRDESGTLVTVDIDDVTEAVIEAIEFDAGLAVTAGGSGVWAGAERGRVTPVEDSEGVDGGQAYVLLDRDGNAYRLTVQALA